MINICSLIFGICKSSTSKFNKRTEYPCVIRLKCISFWSWVCIPLHWNSGVILFQKFKELQSEKLKTLIHFRKFEKSVSILLNRKINKKHKKKKFFWILGFIVIKQDLNFYFELLVNIFSMVFFKLVLMFKMNSPDKEFEK